MTGIDPDNISYSHITLIAGYVIVDGYLILIMYDPLPVRTVENGEIVDPGGTKHLISYEKLYCGANGILGESDNQYVWHGTIAVATPYDNYRIPYHYRNQS